MGSLYTAHIYPVRKTGFREDVQVRLFGPDGEPLVLDAPSGGGEISSEVLVPTPGAGLSVVPVSGEAPLQSCKTGRAVTLQGVIHAQGDASLAADQVLFTVDPDHAPDGSVIIPVIPYSGANVITNNRAKVAANGEVSLAVAVNHAFPGAPSCWAAFACTWIAKA